MAKHFSKRGLSIHRCYTVEEAGLIIGATPQTIRSFEKRYGLEILKGKIPHLIRGKALIECLDARKTPKRPPKKSGEFDCLSCKRRGEPLGMMADYFPMTSSRGRLSALCGGCEASCSTFVGKDKLTAYAEVLEIVEGSH